jgi:hypothetical protein
LPPQHDTLPSESTAHARLRDAAMWTALSSRHFDDRGRLPDGLQVRRAIPARRQLRRRRLAAECPRSHTRQPDCLVMPDPPARGHAGNRCADAKPRGAHYDSDPPMASAMGARPRSPKRSPVTPRAHRDVRGSSSPPDVVDDGLARSADLRPPGAAHEGEW